MDDKKKPGARDISDLKARLGLKKPAAAPAGGSLPAPPAAGAAIPSPFAPPQQTAAETAPEPVDPRRDPFAAQQQAQAANLAAFYGIGQVLPGSSEGVSSEALGKPKPWGRIGLFAIAVVLIFGVGNACGRIYTGRVEYNRTTDQAGQIREEVDKLGKALSTITETARSAKAEVDFDTAKALGELDLKKPDTTKIFHTNYYSLEDVAIERLFTYYNDTIALYDAVAQHSKKTEADRQPLESYLKAGGSGKADKLYGVVLDMSAQVPRAQFVEVGGPVCPTPGETNCTPAELKLKYRTASGAAYSERPVKGKPGEIIIPMQPTDLFVTVASGNPDILAYKDYIRRLANIQLLIGKLMASQKDVIADLKKASDRPKLFTF